MPPTYTNEGIVAAKSIRTRHPRTGVVVLQYLEADDVFELLEDGVSGLGYLLKERVSDLDELIRALHEVARGGSALDPRAVEGLLARGASESASPLLGLTDREREVLAEMATGRSNSRLTLTIEGSARAVPASDELRDRLDSVGGSVRYLNHDGRSVQAMSIPIEPAAASDG